MPNLPGVAGRWPLPQEISAIPGGGMGRRFYSRRAELPIDMRDNEQKLRPPAVTIFRVSKALPYLVGKTRRNEMAAEIVCTCRLLGVRSKFLSNILAAVLLGSVLFAPAARADDGEIVHTAGNVTYVSGGVGTESLDQLRSIAKDFNLKLVFAMKSGEFLSGIEIAIADAAGKSLLNVSSEGPWLLAKLPAGRYKISATFTGNALTRTVSVDAATLHTVDFRWAQE